MRYFPKNPKKRKPKNGPGFPHDFQEWSNEFRRKRNKFKDLMSQFSYSNIPGLTRDNKQLNQRAIDWIRATINDLVFHQLNPDPFVSKISDMFSELGMRLVFGNTHFSQLLEKALSQSSFNCTKCLEAIQQYGPQNEMNPGFGIQFLPMPPAIFNFQPWHPLMPVQYPFLR